ncbi:MAG: nitrite reductase [Flavobacteriales bacterium]
MKSFRSEIENPIVAKDIIELDKKIRLYKNGKLDDTRFKSLRLARGIYGQRQPGVQMVRIKIPFGKFSSQQLRKLADVSDEYSRGRLHVTTRQDVQIHHVNINRTPQLWEELEQSSLTIREACGNVVRNITASETSGIDPDEAFDVSPYAYALFQYLLRNPMCQEMGRKFKISFSASDKDVAVSFIHDLGFIAKIKDGKRGFKVMLGGGIGAQPLHAQIAYEFLPEDKIIPFTEGVLRVFDYYGERTKRMKARMKFLLKEVGLEEFLRLVKNEEKALPHHSYPIDTSAFEQEIILPTFQPTSVKIDNPEEFEVWKKTNVIKQKQSGLLAVGIRLILGDFYTTEARKLADIIEKYSNNEARFTIGQGILLRNIKEEYLPEIYLLLKEIGFSKSGYKTTVDIASCPGTDTCNLGISSSTGIARELEKVIENEYSEFISNQDITIKVSGCMNACGQHSLAQIGFQGMSIKSGELVAPALQVLLGGGILGNGEGRFADKVIKIPSKRGLQALRLLLNDYKSKKEERENFLDYYDRQGKIYFFDLLKELSQTDNLTEDDYIDWGHEKPYIKSIGVGECAAVIIDLVATLLFESEEKISFAQENLEVGNWADSIYHSYSSLVNSAKALLTSDQHETNRYNTIIKQFDEYYVKTGKIQLNHSFESLVNQIKNNNPTEDFARNYLDLAKLFYKKVDHFRVNQLIKDKKITEIQ